MTVRGSPATVERAGPQLIGRPQASPTPGGVAPPGAGSMSTEGCAMSGSTPVAQSGSGSERRPSFTSGGEVFREIQRDVEAVLARKGIRTRALIQLHLKTVIAILLPIIGWIVLMTTSPGVLLGIACLLVVGLGAMLVAFC